MSSCYEISIEVDLRDCPNDWEKIVDRVREAGIGFENALLTGSGQLMFDPCPGNYRWGLEEIQAKIRDVIWEAAGRFVEIEINTLLLDHIPNEAVIWQESDYRDWEDRRAESVPG